MERMDLRFEQMRREISAETAHHIRSHQEMMQAMIRSLDDRYKDLPSRVHALESAVFNDKPR
jgi:hypothetical protein